MSITIDLEYFDEDEIRDFAIRNLGLIDPDDVDIDLIPDWVIVKHIKGQGYRVSEKKYYPHGSIIEEDVLNRLVNNLDKLPLSELTSLLDKHNCI